MAQAVRTNVKNDGFTSRRQLDMNGCALDEDAALSPYAQQTRDINSILAHYFKDRSPEFCLLAELREKGWNNPQGDEHFKKQRHTADNPIGKPIHAWHSMMKKIGAQMHAATDAFHVETFPGSTQCRIIDFCAAPGGYLHTALVCNPGATALAFSLPLVEGGHLYLLLEMEGVDLIWHDITMFAADMGICELSTQQLDRHPDAAMLQLVPYIQADARFHIAICDGQVLRTHKRASYRETREASRLITAQLAMGLEHLESGGTMVVLLHKLEQWNNVSLIHTFSKFSSVQLFKPNPHHAIRSSLYMIVREIQSHSEEALQAVQHWKNAWRAATFDDEEEYQKSSLAVVPSVQDIEALLEDIGPQLVNLARPIWSIQANALEKASWTK